MTLNFTTNKSQAFIYDYLTNMQKYVSVHPVIQKMDDLGGGNYLVHETLKLGIPFSFTYPASITGDVTGERVTMRATVFKVNKIEMVFVIKKDGEFSSVEETISFKSFLPIKTMMGAIFKEQHHQLFANIGKLS